ncbi:MAG: P-loop NTPase fold protein [Xenococcaceae cyanobacterium]
MTQYLKSPDYDSQIAFIEQFHEDFSKIVNAYAGKGRKVYVFIDDLDRCELGKSADLLQALNLMISNDPNLIFILGMDREKVAAAITFKQKDVLPYLDSIARDSQESEPENHQLMKKLDYGFNFLEKFVQLSFSVPKPSENTLEIFLKQLSSDKQQNPQETTTQDTPPTSSETTKRPELKPTFRTSKCSIR